MNTTETQSGSSLDPLVLPRCPHGFQPYGYWVNTIIPKTLWQISLPCCMWYQQAENETAAVKLYEAFLRQNVPAQRPPAKDV
jgi:hypothetical protein